MNIYLMVLFSIILVGCTYTITMVHTSGSASDVVDDTNSTQPKIDATLNIPLK